MFGFKPWLLIKRGSRDGRALFAASEFATIGVGGIAAEYGNRMSAGADREPQRQDFISLKF